MALPAPNLDDRRFQDLVDDAKRLVQRHCPEWTDHNVSDPGVTLIETFAMMVDQLLYRLNRVPDRLYVKFLELIGVRLRPPAAARTVATFYLSAPQPATVRVPARTEVATIRTETVDAISFVTVQPADALPTRLAHVATGRTSGDYVNHNDDLAARKGFGAFSDRPAPDDCLYIGLDRAAPWCVVTLRFVCSVSGVGVDPENPPFVWEACTGEGTWVRCDVEADQTKAFNLPGDVVIHLPRNHVASIIGRRSAGWLRCRLRSVDANQPTYSEPPHIQAAEAFTTGVDCVALHAEFEERETFGTSDGTPGQRFLLAHAPLVPTNDALVVRVAEHPDQLEDDDVDAGWEVWTEVDNFAASGPDDRHFTLDLISGEVAFGPAVRLADGRLGQFGRVPPLGAVFRMDWYWHGGGARGNVAQGRIEVLKSPVRLIRAVANRRAAGGGVDPETVEEAKVRGPVELRTIDRAVTAEDFELLVRRFAPEIARVRCLGAADHGEAGAVRVLLVPHADEYDDRADDDNGAVPFERFQVSVELRERIRDELDQRRLVSTRLTVDEPIYRWVTVVARVRPAGGVNNAKLELELQRAIHRYLHPVQGGPDGRGWPFGRPLHMGEVYATLQRVRGVEYVDQVRLFAVDPTTRRPGEEFSRLVLGPQELVYSFRHDIRVEGP